MTKISENLISKLKTCKEKYTDISMKIIEVDQVKAGLQLVATNEESEDVKKWEDNRKFNAHEALKEEDINSEREKIAEAKKSTKRKMDMENSKATNSYCDGRSRNTEENRNKDRG